MASELEHLRKQIDELDRELLHALSRRLELVKEVGKYKKAHQLAPLQPARWQAVLEDRKKRGAIEGLEPQFVTDIWERIHDEALKIEQRIQEEQ